jgi:hypothetical protein
VQKNGIFDLRKIALHSSAPRLGMEQSGRRPVRSISISDIRHILHVHALSGEVMADHVKSRSSPFQ